MAISSLWIVVNRLIIVNPSKDQEFDRIRENAVNEVENGGERFPWAGPALFAGVALALVAFFWWFL